MELNAISTTILFGILLGILILFVFGRQKRRQQHNLFLLFVTCLILTQVHAFLVRTGLMMHTTWILNINTPLIFLFGPLAWFYSAKVTGHKASKVTIGLNYLPFVLYFGYSFFFFLQPTVYKQHVIASMTNLPLPTADFSRSFSADPWDIQGWVVVEILSLHLLVYALASLWMLYQRSESSVSRSLIQWVKYLNVILLLGAVTLFLSEGGVINGKVFFNSPFPPFSADLFSTIAMYAMTLYLMLNPSFLRQNGPKYRNSKIPEDLVTAKVDKLRALIEIKKLYLRPDFSIDLLSTESGISKHHLSQIINKGMQTSFFEMTNAYRIAEAKRLLTNLDHVKMENLAAELGYRSKSSFFTAFKRITRTTPAKYAAQVA